LTSNPYSRDDLHTRIARLEHALCVAEYRREQAERKLKMIATLLKSEGDGKVRFTNHAASLYVLNALAAVDADTEAPVAG
jgi:hypothetical protein